MALGGVLGNGSKVAISLLTTSPLSLQLIGQLMNLDEIPQLVAADIDNTVMSTSNIKTNMPGMIDPPQFQFTLLADLDPATSPVHELLRKLQQGSGDATSGNNAAFRIEIPTNRQQTVFRALNFLAYVKEYGPAAPIEDKQTVKITAKYAGGYAWDTGAGPSIIS